MRDRDQLEQEIYDTRTDLRDKIALLRAKLDVRARVKEAVQRPGPLVLALVVGAVLVIALYVKRRLTSR